MKTRNDYITEKAIEKGNFEEAHHGTTSLASFNTPSLPPLSSQSPPLSFSSTTMKLTTLSPKHLFRSKKSRSSTVSRSDPPSFSSSSDGSSSSTSSSTNLNKPGSTTPTTVLLPSTNSDLDVDLVQAFKIMDKDNDGKITRTELEILLSRVVAEPLSDEELTLMLTDLDRESDGGCVSLDKFGEISSVIGPACGSEIRDAFEIFDADRDGKISAEELMGVFIAIGDEECTLDDCRRMIAGVDSDGDGFVCFDDFTRMMEHQQSR